jgi:ankyrin repeat protein
VTENLLAYDELEKACISRLNTADTSNYESRIQRQAKGTLDWLKNKSEYITWEQSKISQLLWVTGHIGCGKTTMALYVLHTLAKDQGPRDIICRYFCDDKEMSYDATPLLRALIYQMVHRRSKLLRIVRRALDRGGIQMLHQFDALWDIFVQVACDNRVVSVSVIIDGIERYDRKTQIMLVDRISELLDSDVPARVKFFITSGPNAHAFRSIYLKPAKLLLLELEHEQEMIAKDINLFIHQRLELLVGRKICTPSNSDEIEQILINKAGRSFLWVSIVLPILEERLVLRTIDVISIAHELQPEIYPSFDKLLYSISPYEREVVGQLLRLIVVSGRALSGDELSILIGITPQTKSVALLEEDKLPMDGRMVIARLGPLIRDCNSKISLNYTTMKEYLVHLSSTPKHPLSATFGINLQRDTRTLVSACTQYLALHEFGEDLFQRGAAHVDMVMPSEISDQASTPTQEVADFTFSLAGDALFEEEEDWDVKLSMNAAARRYKLFDYAALHWATDFLRCGDVEENVNVEVDSALRVAQGGLETVSVVCGRDQTRLTNWLRYFWISKGLTEPCVPAHPLIVASYFGHIKTLRRALDSPPSHDDGTLWNCLFWASRQGHTLCVKTLLKHPNFPSALNPIQAISPFHVAAEYGHADVVLALIENDDQLNVNGLDSTGRTALSLAAANGHAEVVAVLFAHPRIKVNQPDKNGYMPVLWATLAKSERVMAYFLTDQRVDLDCEDKEKRTPLSWAAEECAVGVISKLIQSKRVNMAHRDSDGRTPISYAAKHGHLDVVQLLLDSEPEQASIQDNHGRNAHSWAASQPNSGVLHELWKCNPLGADVKDKDGWTPLLWAMDPPGYPENVTELLQCKNIDINGNDNGNRTPLSWAASCGYVSIARTLSRTSGIDLDSKDAQGRTPLSHAAGNGNTEIVSLLLSYNGVDVNSTDNAGRTPLVWAASQGCCEVISLLLSQPHINHFLQDKLGRLPIEVALAHGQDRAAQILQASKIRGNPRRDSRP